MSIMSAGIILAAAATRARFLSDFGLSGRSKYARKWMHLRKTYLVIVSLFCGDYQNVELILRRFKAYVVEYAWTK